MKKHVFASAALLLPLFGGLVGCTQPGQDEVQYIKVSMASCSFRGVDAEPLRIEVSTSPAAWNAEPSATWIRIVEKTDNALLLTVDDNMSAAERTGEVTITAGQAEQSITIVQVSDHALQSTYGTTGEFTMGAVISPNARYVGGYTCIYDTEAGNWVNQVVIIDIRNDKKYMLDPFPDTLYPLYDPCAITDSGNVFFHCEDGKIVMFSLSGDVTVLDNVPGAGKPWLSQVASDESGVWVGFCLGGETLYSPVKWTDGVPEILQKPETTYRGYGWYQGCMARGCSLDGSIIYGTAWEGLDSGLIWWDREGTPRWVGDKVRKLKSVKIYDTATGTYTDYTLVDGIVGSSDPYYMSPSGKWIAGTYRTEELAENETDVIYTSCPAFYDTETDEVHIFSEYEGAVGMTVTDEGLGVIGMNGASGIISHTVMVNIPTATEAGTSTEWIYDTYGIIIPDNSLLEYISPDGRTAFGYDLSGEMEPMRKWYVTRKTAE